MAFKRVTMSFADSLSYKPDYPERTARMSMAGIGGTIVFQTWPSRTAMARTIRMQQKGEPRATHWQACQKLTDTEGY